MQVKQEGFLKLISLPFSCFFCQQLYFYLNSTERKDILESCFSSLDNLLKSNHSVLAFVFIIENELPIIEQNLIIKLVEEQFTSRSSNIKFLRLLESIVNCFSHELMHPLLLSISKEIINLISLKQGYFLIRALIRSSKNPTVQLSIVKAISGQFSSIAKSLSGSLLIQCMLHNFLCPEFIYEKCCSSNTWALKDQVLAFERKYPKSSMSSFPLNLVLSYLFENIIHWDNSSIVPIVSCAIKNRQTNFNECFVYYLGCKQFLQILVKLGSINFYISNICEFYSPALMLQLHLSILQIQNQFSFDAEALKFIIYIANLIISKLRQLGIPSFNITNRAVKPNCQQAFNNLSIPKTKR